MGTSGGARTQKKGRQSNTHAKVSDTRHSDTKWMAIAFVVAFIAAGTYINVNQPPQQPSIGIPQTRTPHDTGEFVQAPVETVTRNTPAPQPESVERRDIEVCHVGPGSAYASIESLLQTRDTPCLVRGLFAPKKMEKVMRAWSLASLRKLEMLRLATVTLRVTEGSNRTRVMRYSNRRLQPSWDVFENKAADLAFVPDEYDAWEFKPSTLQQSIFAPAPDHMASFSTSVGVLKEVYDKGYKSAMKLMQSVCPYGCTKKMATDQLIWIASAGLGQQLHFDAHANLFLHIDGPKSVVLAPPDVIGRTAHLFPSPHPAARQSQLRWNKPTPDRVAAGFTSHGGDFSGAVLNYSHAEEQIVPLKRGDVLYLPAYWGHQTFSADAPTVSLALWFFPAAVDPRTRPEVDASAQRESGLTAARLKATNAVLASAHSPTAAWAALRELGEQLVVQVFDIAHDQAKEKVATWREQRWRPQFETLGIDPTTQLPDAVCGTIEDPTVVTTAAKRLAAYLRGMADWHFPQYRDTILWLYTSDVLDSLIEIRKSCRMEGDLLSAGFKSSQSQLGVLLRSFGSCRS